MEPIWTSSFYRDLASILEHFDKIKAESAAMRLVEAIDETVDFIVQFPALGNPWEESEARYANVRFRLVKRFENLLDRLFRRERRRSSLPNLARQSRRLRTARLIKKTTPTHRVRGARD